MAVVLLYVTAASADEALRMGRALVEARLVACANVIPGITSVYHWEGRVQQEGEAVLILKTVADLTEAAVERINVIHEYSCPCVVVLPITGGNRAFLDWIAKETRPTDS